jgi:hypothetical protein
MIEKIAGLARLLATLLAIVAGFVAVPANLNLPLVLVVLGLIAGLRYRPDELVALFLVVLVLPLAGLALGTIPEIGDNLNAAFNNIALAASAVAATVIIMRLFNNSRNDLMAWVPAGGEAPAKAAT